MMFQDPLPISRAPSNRGAPLPFPSPQLALLLRVWWGARIRESVGSLAHTSASTAVQSRRSPGNVWKLGPASGETKPLLVSHSNTETGFGGSLWTLPLGNV